MFIDIYVFCVILFSNFLQTTTGFGYAIVTTPLLALVLPAKESVMLTMLTGLIARLSMLRLVKSAGCFRDIMPLVFTGIIGSAVGAYTLVLINDYWLKIFIAVILLFTAWGLWKDRRIEIKHPQQVERLVGACSGFLGSTTSINGPPIIMYYLNAGMGNNKELFRAHLTRYFLVMNVIGVLFAYGAGTMQIVALWKFVLYSLPALVVGVYFGERLFQRINAQAFKRMTLLMVVCSAVLILINTLK